MFKLLPKYLVWGIVCLSVIAIGLQFFFLHYPILDNGLRLLVLLAALMLKKFYSYLILTVSVVLIVLSILLGSQYTSNGTLAITISYSIISIVLAFALGLYFKKIIHEAHTERLQMTSLFENANEGILLINAQGEIVLANPSVAHMFRYSSNEMLGQKIEILIPPRFRGDHVAKRDQFIFNPGSRAMGLNKDLIAVTKDGNEFPVEVSLSSFKDQKQIFIIAFILDITRRKEYENRIIQQSAELEKKVENRTLVLKEALNKLEQSQKELQDSLEKQKELNELKGKFVSMASHEFRTPLSTVLSSAELIARYREGEFQLKRDKHIERIKHSVHHLNDILEDFLSLGKLEEGGVAAVRTTFDLFQLLETVKSDMETNKKEGQQILIQFFGQQQTYLDKKLLYNVLINLLSNAIKYSPEGSPIILKAINDDGDVLISVKDEGIGISDEDQAHLFTSFFRGSNAATIQGTGLGLHIVKRYVDLLGGEIKVESELNKGTKILVQFHFNNHKNLPYEREHFDYRG